MAHCITIACVCVCEYKKDDIVVQWWLGLCVTFTFIVWLRLPIEHLSVQLIVVVFFNVDTEVPVMMMMMIRVDVGLSFHLFAPRIFVLYFSAESSSIELCKFKKKHQNKCFLKEITKFFFFHFFGSNEMLTFWYRQTLQKTFKTVATRQFKNHFKWILCRLSSRRPKFIHRIYSSKNSTKIHCCIAKRMRIICLA